MRAAPSPPSLWERWPSLAPCLARGTLLACFDYDGTLVPIRPTPEEAVADAATREALCALAATPGTAVAVVSGRPVAQLQQLVPADVLWLVGLHGAELARPAGERVSTLDAAAVAAALAPARALAEELARRHPGVRVEDKGVAVALHTRQAARDDARAAADAFRAGVATLSGFHLLAGKEVLELRPAGVDKGSAVRRLQREAGGEALLYVGDDTTDEDAFAALLEADGAAPAAAHVLTVRVAEQDGGAPPAPTRATCVLAAQEEVSRLLRSLLDLRRGGA